MAAYATPRLRLAAERPGRNGIEPTSWLDIAADSSVLDALIDQLAARVVGRLAAVIERSPAGAPNDRHEWLLATRRGIPGDPSRHTSEACS
jgi:hypothetical protein